MKRVNVLIVDDNELDRYILRRQLTKIGVESIIEKDDGSTALEFLQDYDKNAMLYPDEFPPVVIFLDINMPKLNGFDFGMILPNYSKEQCDHLISEISAQFKASFLELEVSSNLGFAALSYDSKTNLTSLLSLADTQADVQDEN